MKLFSVAESGFTNFTALALLGTLALSLTQSISPAAGQWQDDLAKMTFSSNKGSINYRLLEPKDRDPAKQYPLVVFLHGAGERGDDNQAQLVHGVREFHKRQAEYPCFLIAPQCPTGKRWVERNWSEPTGDGTFEDKPSESMAAVLALVEKMIADGGVDPNRVYITGLSMGGYGTWFASGTTKSPFVAAAPICGGGDPSWAPRYKNLPLWAFHGDADTAVPVARSQEMIEAIRAVGGKPQYTEYPGVGHDSWTQTYANDDFFAWLFAQKGPRG
jgi:predicted peptidase